MGCGPSHRNPCLEIQYCLHACTSPSIPSHRSKPGICHIVMRRAARGGRPGRLKSGSAGHRITTSETFITQPSAPNYRLPGIVALSNRIYGGRMNGRSDRRYPSNPSNPSLLPESTRMAAGNSLLPCAFLAVLVAAAFSQLERGSPRCFASR